MRTERAPYASWVRLESRSAAGVDRHGEKLYSRPAVGFQPSRRGPVRRKPVLLALGLLIVLLAVGALIVGLMLKHQPTFYRDLEMQPGMARQQKSAEFQNMFFDLMNRIKNRDSWHVVCTAEQLNSYFQEDFVRSAGGDANLPEGCRDLRVVIGPNHLRLACRYGDGLWSTVITLDLKLWLVAKELNMLAVEIQGLKAGALPLSPQILLDSMTEAARNAGMEVTWYRHEGNPVAILRYQPNQPRPTLVVHRFELQEGQVVIVGGSPDSTSARAAGPAAP
jgi:hypothetical protein